jgi:hypothetical protein
VLENLALLRIGSMARFERLLTIYAAIALIGMMAEVVFQVATRVSGASGLWALLGISMLTGVAIGVFLLPLFLVTIRRGHKAVYTVGNVTHHVEIAH